MNIYDRKERGLGTTLMPALQALAMQSAKQLQDARQRGAFKEDFMKGGNLNEDQASLMANTMMADPKTAPLFLKVLGEMKNQEALRAQGGLGALGGGVGQGGINLPGFNQPGLEGVNKPVSMLSAAPNSALGVKDILRENRAEKNRSDRLAKEEKAEKWKIKKENQPYIDKLETSKAARREMQESLKAMQIANKSGGINSPFTLGAIGLGNRLTGTNMFDSFKSPQANLFVNQSKKLFGIAKEMFGSRITNQDVKIVMEMLPSLMQSPESREVVINAMMELNNLMEKEYETAQRIIKENGGDAPENLKSLVNKELDSIWPEASQNYQDLLYASYTGGDTSQMKLTPSPITGKTMDEIGGWSGIPEGHVIKEHGKLFMKINGKRTEVVEAGSPGKYKRK